MTFDSSNAPITFKGDANYNGKASFDYTVTDAMTGLTSTAATTVDVGAVNDLPTLTNDKAYRIAHIEDMQIDEETNAVSCGMPGGASLGAALSTTDAAAVVVMTTSSSFKGQTGSIGFLAGNMFWKSDAVGSQWQMQPNNWGLTPKAKGAQQSTSNLTKGSDPIHGCPRLSSDRRLRRLKMGKIAAIHSDSIQDP